MVHLGPAPSEVHHPGATPEQPFYAKVEQDKPHAGGTQMWMITCDEGWRVSIVCTDMYGWAADWLLPHIQGKPYAAGH